MRIHHLRLEAIGPFPGNHDVNFDQLSTSGLFLLEGPTGAGKSTLIDAITYGLYGTLGTAENTKLPSNHAPLSEPVIEVVFSTNAGIHKIRRTPPYERPKKRGGGFTPQNATAKLWRLSSADDDIGEPLASAVQEVGAEMQRILKLTRDQFMQTVVLPQGRFSTFLRAKPEERAVVLRDVFGTAIYQQVQDELAEMSRSARRTITAIEAEVSLSVRAVTTLLDADDPSVAELWGAGSALDTAALISISERVLRIQHEGCERAREAMHFARGEETTARAFLEAQGELARNLARRVSLLTENDALIERGDAIGVDRDRLAAAQRAATVAGSLRTHGAATTGLERAQEALTVVCSRLRDTADHDLVDVVELPALRQTMDDITGERGGLVELMRLESALPERDEQLAVSEAALQQATAALDGERDQLAGRPGKRAQVTAVLGELRATAIPVAVARLAAEQRRTVRDAAQLAEALATQLSEAEQAMARAGAEASDATERENTVRLRWINSVAGALATDLEDGTPCAVCGALEHPDPAPELPDHASLDDVDEATTRRERAVAALQERDRAHTRLIGEVEAQQQAAHNATSADAEVALVAAEAEVASAEETVELIEKAEKTIVDFDQETDVLNTRIAAAETSTATAAERLRGDRQIVQIDEKRCEIAAGDCLSVAVRVQQLEDRLTRAKTLAEARQGHEDADHRLTDATVALDEGLRDADFEDAEAARVAQLGNAESTELQQRVRKHDAALTHVSRGLAEESIAALTGDEAVDVPAAKQSHGVCHEELMAATAADATAAACHEQCERAQKALVKVLSRQERLTDEAAPVLRMAELANAGEGNSKSTTLSTFVLLRRFEDVVAAANDRLSVMSNGRFSLLRIDEREGRARRAGLGLSVRDHHTETNRDPHTLSGGETFYVSLCLALGLADVVTSEAGGISLDTLFIDEGFGSLDSDTLDGVLGELAHLQAGGRAVGIVSHVAELKARIPERVEITRRPGGGSTLRVLA